jgi:hypothetical protein
MTIIFSKNFYNLKSIKEAAGIYRNFADFDLKNAPKTIGVTLKNIGQKDKERIRDEFSNYALFLSLNQRNQNVK